MFNLALHIKDLPLDGSEAQARWARTLRHRKAEELTKLGISRVGQLMASHVTPLELEQARLLGAERLMSFVSAVMVNSLSCPHAKWWIDHREDDPAKWLPNAARTVIEAYIATPPYSD